MRADDRRRETGEREAPGSEEMFTRFGPAWIGVLLLAVGAAALAIHYLPGFFEETEAPAPIVSTETGPPSAGPEPTSSPGSPESQTREPSPPSPADRVLVSSLAGRWYPGDRAELERAIRGYLEGADGERIEHVQALILPHAGYQYSGPTAAFGIRQIAGRAYRRVVVLGPSHRVAMENVASLPEATRLRTPLGEVPFDLEFLDALRRHPMFQDIPQAIEGEHSVEIEVPLLQEALGEFRLVPIVVGQLDADAARRMARILRGLVDRDTLVVASSDFTHYGRNFGYTPFREEIPENLRKLDLAAFEKIREKNVEGFLDFVAETGATICGRSPISVLLAMLPEESKAHVLRYDTSGALTHDFSSSVSYLAVAFEGAWTPADPASPASTEPPLDGEDHARLLRLARRTIELALDTYRVPEVEETGIELTPGMKAIRGAFVTLEENGELRGCIGDIIPQRPLYRSVMINAIHAALNDRRFRPVTAEELPKLHIEISALTPQVPVASAEEIVVGKHGVVLSKDGHRAVFLPQVAPEQGWSREEMLAHLARKAGLRADAWRDGAAFTVFEAEVFGEEEPASVGKEAE